MTEKTASQNEIVVKFEDNYHETLIRYHGNLVIITNSIKNSKNKRTLVLTKEEAQQLASSLLSIL